MAGRTVSRCSPTGFTSRSDSSSPPLVSTSPSSQTSCCWPMMTVTDGPIAGRFCCTASIPTIRTTRSPRSRPMRRGAIYMSEGVFLHSQVETPYGPQRGVDGGVWRFDPGTWRLERFIQTSFSNPWGFVFDEWDQPFVSDASPGDNWWGLPLSAKTPHGGQTTKYAQFTTQRVRPTAGSEFISSRHFPDRFPGRFSGQQHDRFPRHQAACGGG